MWSLGDTTISANCVRFGPEGKKVYVGSWGGKVINWEVETGKKRWEVLHEGHKYVSINEITFSRDNTQLLVAFGSGELGGIQRDTGDKLLPSPADFDKLKPMSTSPDGRHVIQPATKGAIRLKAILEPVLIKRFQDISRQ